MSRDRSRQLVASFVRESCDAFLTYNISNIRYLCGWTAEGVLLVAKDFLCLCVNPLYFNEAKSTVSADVAVVKLGDEPFKQIAMLIKKSGAKTLALDNSAELTLRRFNAIKEKCAAHNIAVKPLSGTIEKIRAKKSASELASMRKAIAISQACYGSLEPLFTAGTPEKTVRIAAETYLKLQADLALAFDPIVASGKNAASPHYTAQDAVFGKNTAVLFDQGCKVDGYCSDLTRMFVIGKTPARFDEIKSTVLRSIDAAVAAVKPGVKCSAVDAAARNVIEKAGYGKYFVHGTGHGVGLDVHEYPSVSSKSDAILEAGMVITIEPGIYLPGKYAFRQEHMVLVTSKGHEIMDEVSCNRK